MPVASSQYWKSVHGNTTEEACLDTEGIQTMHTLGRNTALNSHNIKQYPILENKKIQHTIIR